MHLVAMMVYILMMVMDLVAIMIQILMMGAPGSNDDLHFDDDVCTW